MNLSVPIGGKLMFNPKRHGLFGLPDTWGGLIQSILEKRSVTPPNFILEQQTESHTL